MANYAEWNATFHG